MSTTAMNKAIKEAGIAIPTNRRIWQWLKDNGEHTGSEVALALKIPLSASSSIISNMVDRKMLKVNKKFSNHAGRLIGYYSAVGREFVVLPQSNRVVPKRVAKEEEVVAAPVAQAVSEIVPVAPLNPVTNLLNNLSVVQAFDLYQQLDGMFNRQKN